VIKPRRAEPQCSSTVGPAVVFADYNDMAARIERPAHWAVNCRIGARAAERGPAGAPGMPEWGSCRFPRKLPGEYFRAA